MKYLFFVFLTLLYTQLSSSQTPWLEVTRTKAADCRSNQPCFFTQDNSKVRFKFVASYNIEKNKKFLKKVIITNERTGKKSEYSGFKNFQSLYSDEKLPLMLVDLNSDGRMDLAMNASLSARRGPFYFYWIYDHKNEQFILTNEQIEKLGLNTQGLLRGLASGDFYKVEKNKKIVKSSTPAKSEKTK